MPWALFESITGLFDKRFLFAAYLPTVIFLLAIVLTLTGVVGWGSTFDWWASLEATQKAALSAGGVGLSIIGAYVLTGVRPALVALWSGTFEAPLVRDVYALGEWVQRRRYDRLTRAAEQPPVWGPLLTAFRTKAANAMTAAATGSPKNAPPHVLSRRLAALRHLSASAGLAAVKAESDRVAALYQNFAVDSLTDVYARLLAILNERIDREEQSGRDARVRRNRCFGPVATIRATRFGNIVQAYIAYPFSRYRFESEAFWPALRSTVPPEALGPLDDSRVYVDFSIGMASYGGLFAVLSMLGGPWIWWSPTLWVGLAGAAGVVSYGFYRLAVVCIDQYGDIYRSFVDLQRLALMKALHRARPLTLREEREQWGQLSQLVLYGDTAALDFPIAPL
ncbi:MAG: hypothetical protein SF182_20465 [Deltaproteobacteria bacterium]|nr:hypothetical protein [Deltaproteobacteria bacterium]